MYFLDKLERAFGRYAIPNLALYLIIGQVFVLLAGMLGRLDLEMLDLAPALVLEGRQWWRVVTFMFIVPIPTGMLGSTFGLVFTAFGWYLFYLMSNALEHHWGAFRFNVYLLLSYGLTVALSFVTPDSWVTNLYILGSVFLAFAYLNPEFEILLFFVLPVKIKWLAIITWALNLVQFVRGDLAEKLQIASSVVAFFVFFGPDMVRTLRQGRRVAARRAERAVEEVRARHTCHVCGKTDRSHPQLDFRYCSKCAGDQCYCPEHIQNHAHVVAADDSKSR
jgi:hypothetical protein